MFCTNSVIVFIIINILNAIVTCLADNFSVVPPICPFIPWSSVPEWIQTNIDAHNNLAEAPNALLESYDFIVVGGGSGGSVVASRLSENLNTTVLLIEAGGAEDAFSDTPGAFLLSLGPRQWTYVSEPVIDRTFLNTAPTGRLSITFGKMFGGSSSHNSMAYFRGSYRVFDDWENSGAVGWAWDDVYPVFKYSEDNTDPNFLSNGFHGSGGPLTVSSTCIDSPVLVANYAVDAFTELGFDEIDLNGPYVRVGTNCEQQCIANGTRVSMAKAFLEPVRDERPNLHVLANTQVTRVLLSPNNTAIGVEYIRNNQTYTATANIEVILCAGVIESPHILLNSGVGPEQQLSEFNISTKVNLAGVGQNLMDHPTVLALRFTFPKNGSLANDCNEYVFNMSGQLAHFDSGVAFINSCLNNDTDWPDIWIYSANLSNLAPALNTTSFSLNVVNVHPLSRGFVELSSADPLVQPIVQPNYLEDPHDLDVLIDGLRWVYRIAQTIVFDGFGDQAFVNLTPGCQSNFSLIADTLYPNMSIPCDDYLECVARRQTSRSSHFVGTCKMGSPYDIFAVVNPSLQVLGGVSRLRVCDASVMPVVTNCPSNAAVVTIAERCAQFIKDDYC